MRCAVCGLGNLDPGDVLDKEGGWGAHVIYGATIFTDDLCSSCEKNKISVTAGHSKIWILRP